MKADGQVRLSFSDAATYSTSYCSQISRVSGATWLVQAAGVQAFLF